MLNMGSITACAMASVLSGVMFQNVIIPTIYLSTKAIVKTVVGTSIYASSILPNTPPVAITKAFNMVVSLIIPHLI